MSDDRAIQISDRLAAATPGPWEASQDWIDFGVKDNSKTVRQAGVAYSHIASVAMPYSLEENADLIANAPSDLAWLLAERAELLRRVETAERAELKQVVHAGLGINPTHSVWPEDAQALLRLLDAERARADAAEAKLAAIQPTPTPPHWPARAATDPDGTVQWADSRIDDTSLG